MLGQIFMEISKCYLCLIYSVDGLFLCVCELLNINCCKKCQKSPFVWRWIDKKVPEVTHWFVDSFGVDTEVITEAVFVSEREKKSSLQPEKSTINESFLLAAVSWQCLFLASLIDLRSKVTAAVTNNVTAEGWRCSTVFDHRVVLFTTQTVQTFLKENYSNFASHSHTITIPCHDYPTVNHIVCLDYIIPV